MQYRKLGKTELLQWRFGARYDLASPHIWAIWGCGANDCAVCYLTNGYAMT